MEDAGRAEAVKLVQVETHRPRGKAQGAGLGDELGERHALE